MASPSHSSGPSRPRVGFVHHEACLDHDAGAGHPERAERIRSILERLTRSGLVAELDQLRAQEPDPAALARVHGEAYLRKVIEVCDRAPAWLDAGDTRVSEGSLRAAALAVGGALAAVDRVQAGEWRSAFVCTRPPGHHAERERGMGFCLYNNVAIAARHLQSAHGLERVAVLDWDVHHGNGTQDVFWNDPSVFYASLHQFPHFPGTGAREERGGGDAQGATWNEPLAAGTGDAEWMDALEERVLPQLEAFRPEFILVSAGFDAHERDPLSSTRVTTDGYRRMTRSLLDVANRVCAGRVVAVLEGGYDREGLSSSVAAHIEELHFAPPQGALNTSASCA